MINTAIEIALEAHKNQFRKGTKIPYVTHPLSVGIILAKAGFPDEVIAAGIQNGKKDWMNKPVRNVEEGFLEGWNISTAMEQSASYPLCARNARMKTKLINSRP